MPETLIKPSVENYDLNGPRFYLRTLKDVAMADAVFAAMCQVHPTGWTYEMLVDEVEADPSHPFRELLTHPDAAVRAAWITDMRGIAHEIKVIRQVPADGDGSTKEVSVRKYLAVDDPEDEEDRPVLVIYDESRENRCTLDQIRKAYAKRVRALVNEWIGYRDVLHGFSRLESLANAVHQQYLTSGQVTKTSGDTSRALRHRQLDKPGKTKQAPAKARKGNLSQASS